MTTIIGLVILPYYGVSAVNKISSSSNEEIEEVIENEVDD